MGDRGSAGVLALVTAAVLMSAAAWFAITAGGPVPVGGGPGDAPSGRNGQGQQPPGPEGLRGEEARALIARVSDLSSRIEEEKDAVAVPAGLEFARSKPTGTERVPDVDDLTGTLEGSFIVLRWKATGEHRGFRVERLDENGRSEFRQDLGADATTWRDGPVRALRGTRNYRVSAIGVDGNVYGADQEPVSFEVVDHEVTFLGAVDEKRSRFRVTWQRAEATVVEDFVVARGDEIGGTVPAQGERPELDLRTGWRFREFRGRRRTKGFRKLEVPRFTPEGAPYEDPRTGKVVFENWEVPLVTIALQAGVDVSSGDGTTRERWLEQARN